MNRLRRIYCALSALTNRELTGCCLALLLWAVTNNNAIAASACDASLSASLKQHRETTVALVHLFKAGEDLNLNGKPSGVLAAHELCVVKLLVGPGNPGPSDAPSTSRGIGVEIWLPSADRWNGRIHATGGGGYAGTPGVSSTTELGTAQMNHFAAAAIADQEGAISALTDTGHIGAGLNGDFGLTPTGEINTRLWEDFAGRAVHEMAIHVKVLAEAYYGHSAQHTYFDGCSLGGRQGHKEAQDYPEDFDGILVGDGALNWTRFLTAEIYGQIIVQRDLSGSPLTNAQLDLVSSAAVSACDTDLTGKHEGYLAHPESCRYDPTRDKTVLCRQDGGSNTTPACVSKVQAQSFNKIWYGQTVDGSVPEPRLSVGFSPALDHKQLWYGLARGTRLYDLSSLVPGLPGLLDSKNGTPMPFTISTSQIAIDLQDSKLAAPSFHNAQGDGQDGWKKMTYKDLHRAQDQGLKMQSALANINTDSANLVAFRDKGGKMIHYYGLADQLIPFPGAAQYYEHVASTLGGYEAVQKFYGLYPVPGMGHCFGTGSVNGLSTVSPPADPPLPAANQLYTTLTDWVEKRQSPHIVIANSKHEVSHPLCAYPASLAYRSGDPGLAESFTCRAANR